MSWNGILAAHASFYTVHDQNCCSGCVKVTIDYIKIGFMKLIQVATLKK